MLHHCSESSSPPEQPDLPAAHLNKSRIEEKKKQKKKKSTFVVREMHFS